MSRKIYILPIASLLSLLLTGCLTSKEGTDTLYINFARKDTALIKEMANFSLAFAEANTVRSFEVSQVADKTKRKKLSSLGAKVEINYHSSILLYTNTVVFKTTNFSGVKEYIFDFSATPKNMGSDTSNGKERLLQQITDRIYYQRRPFPVM